MIKRYAFSLLAKKHEIRTFEIEENERNVFYFKSQIGWIFGEDLFYELKIGYLSFDVSMEIGIDLDLEVIDYINYLVKIGTNL